MNVYRNRHGITVEAIQWTGQNYCDVMDFIGVQDPEPIEEQPQAVIRLGDDETGYADEDGADVHIGDYVVRHQHGRIEVVLLDDFDFEPADTETSGD